MTNLNVRGLEPFGHIVELHELPDASTQAADELRRLYLDEGLLVVRGLQLSHDRQAEFCRIFGPVSDNPY